MLPFNLWTSICTYVSLYVEANIEHDLEGNIFRSTPIVKLVSKIFTHVVPCAFQYVSNKSPEYLES